MFAAEVVQLIACVGFCSSAAFTGNCCLIDVGFFESQKNLQTGKVFSVQVLLCQVQLVLELAFPNVRRSYLRRSTCCREPHVVLHAATVQLGFYRVLKTFERSTAKEPPAK